MDLNYFVCTLGQASRHKSRRTDFTNINDFIERQADEYPTLPAVGFFKTSNESWKTQVLTFNEVFQITGVFANKLSQNLKHVLPKQTVALLCPSSANFLFTWLGLMRLGDPVLLITPQCSVKAVVELCRQCDCSTLVYDEMYQDLANASEAEAESGHGISVLPLPFMDGEVLDMAKEGSSSTPKADDISASDIAYLHHTSGTSTGTSKPIPQTQHAGAGVYAAFEGSDQATFTTTPLYHGGIADLFRAWTSHALIWLFPGKEAPITAKNAVKCLEATEKAGTPPVEFFSSVPYVLEMMAEDPRGVEDLQKMSVVGVGGAALPKAVGDRLVGRNINLVSRFGSAECGFLMSSYRDFAKDREWQYLRCDPEEDKLRFEEREDGLSELVILTGWPHMAKPNREDGSFATSDLFQPCPDVQGAWKYHSRADSQLTLITGKKFDPSPLESAIAASTVMLSDVLIFGNGRPYPGALLFRSVEAKEVSHEELLDVVWPSVEQLNKERQSHARIARNLLILMPFAEQPLEKSSKGTILRGKAEERYATDIEGAYEQTSGPCGCVLDEELPGKVLELVGSIINIPSSESLDLETDLFALGVDSIACVHIRHTISQLIPKGHDLLPLTIVQDCGTVSRLSGLLLAIRQGKQPNVKSDEHIEETMLDLVKHYSRFDTIDMTDSLTPPRTPDNRKQTNIILTGPTGSLGSQLLSQLLALPNTYIHLLLRGSTIHAAKERVLKALQSRKLPIPSDFDARTTIHTIALSKHLLGLSQEVYARLAVEVDVVYYLAWSVDFTLPLSGFKQHFTGLNSIITLALTHRPQPAHIIFCSSTASVSKHPSPISEMVITDPSAAGVIGYSRSKWVAENILFQAKQQHPELRIDIVRAGQLSGNSVRGAWSASEAIPLMLSSAKVTGSLPDLGAREDIRWVPVDVAAGAFVELMAQERKEGDEGEVGVFHVVNPSILTTWKGFCGWVQEVVEGVEIVSVKEWLERLEKLKSRGSEHACLKFWGFWREAYGGSDEADESGVEYAMDRTFEAMPAVANMKPIDRVYALKLWAWIDENV